MIRRILLPLLVMLGIVSCGCQPERLPAQRVAMPLAATEDVLGQWMALDDPATQPATTPATVSARPEFRVSIRFATGPADAMRKEGLLSPASQPAARIVSSKEIDGIIKRLNVMANAALMTSPGLLVRNDAKAVIRIGTDHGYIADLDLSGPVSEPSPIIRYVPTGVWTTVRVREAGGNAELAELDGRTCCLLGIRTCIANGGNGPAWHEAIALLGQAAIKAPVTIGPDEALVIPLQYRMYQTVAAARAVLRGPVEEHGKAGTSETYPCVMIVQVRKVEANLAAVAADR